MVAVPLAASIALAAYACKDDPSSQPLDASSDGSANDGSMVPLDAFSPVDGETPEAGPGGLVTVYTLDQSKKPVPGTSVYFVEAGATTSTVVTSDATGKATYTYQKAGSVHVPQYGGGANYFVTSVMAVSAGDVVTFTGHYKSSGTPIQGVQGSFSAAPIDGGASLVYNVSFGNCTAGGTFNNAGMSYGYGLYQNCLGTDGNLNVLLYGLGAVTLEAYAYHSLMPSSDAGSQLVQNFPALDFVAAPQQTGTFTGTFPAWAQQGQTSLFFPVDGMDLITLNLGPLGGAQTMFPFGTLQASLAPFTVIATTLSAAGPLKVYGRRVRRLATMSGFQEDYGAFLPRMTSATVDTSGATPTVSWVEETAFTTSKTMNVQLTGPGEVDGSGGTVGWNVVFPAGKGTMSATIPALPTELASYVSTGWALTGLSASASPQGGYAALKLFPDEANDPAHLVRDLPLSLGIVEITQSSLSTK